MNSATSGPAPASPASRLQRPAPRRQLIGVPEALPRVGALIGTPERLKTHATHRKQTTAHTSNRYSSHLASAHVLHGFPETRRVWGPLPETANRVETHLSHRKQTIGCLSTRDGSRRSVDWFSAAQFGAAPKAAALHLIPADLLRGGTGLAVGSLFLHSPVITHHSRIALFAPPRITTHDSRITSFYTVRRLPRVQRGGIVTARLAASEVRG